MQSSQIPIKELEMIAQGAKHREKNNYKPSIFKSSFPYV